MCGICGIYIYGSKNEEVGQGILVRMRDTMIHRGPDDAGVYISSDKSVGLAHRRLSIIDLSSAGRQPMSNEDGSIWITFNGEFYNFKDYRENLIKKGHRFKSRTDTEVIVHLYEEVGLDVIHKIRGMFSFGLWDENKKLFILVRDRLGIKPLYYTLLNGKLIFASEIKAILEHPEVKRELNPEAFYHYLTFATVPAPLTLFKNIYKLPAGFLLLIDSNGNVKKEQYWDVFQNEHRSGTSKSEEDYCEELLSHLRESIRLRMISDVPFGVFLSGGLDSSTNVALMSELMDRPVTTFSVGYKGVRASNEFHYAREIANKFNTEHHELFLSQKDVLKFLPNFIFHQDDLIADPACIPTYYLAELARENKTIVLQVGEGSDELFCGYPEWVRTLKIYQSYWKAFSALPQWLKRVISIPLALFKDKDVVFRAVNNQEYFLGGTVAFTEFEKQQLLSHTFKEQISNVSSFQVVKEIRKKFELHSNSESYLNWMSYIDINLRLPEFLLARVDRMTMAASIEARVPFLDHKFVEFAMSMPPSFKYKNWQTKYILRESVKGILPQQITQRIKEPFPIPLEHWFRSNFTLLLNEQVSNLSRLGFINEKHVLFLMESHKEGKLNCWFQLWTLLCFSLWYQRWILKQDLEFDFSVQRKKQVCFGGIKGV
jgi:asparagine synthase (glutamine-hydrolysing)